ncbi:MAG: MarR family transcriptional regulator [Leptospiraceae bacterium]|nr:MarR family transcriptional regulator [Leptospiraceae bacterium]
MKLRTKKYETPENSPGFKIWQMSNVWQKKMSQALEDVGLTHTQFVLLAGLYGFHEKGEETTQTKLAEKTNTDVMMTSQVLRKLEAKGYVRRKSHEMDSRAKKIFLTKKGSEIINEAMRIAEQVDGDFFTSSISDPKKLNTFLGAVNIVF